MNTYKSPNEIVRESRMNRRRISFQLTKSDKSNRSNGNVRRVNFRHGNRQRRPDNSNNSNNGNNIDQRNRNSRGNPGNRRRYNLNRQGSSSTRLYISNLPLKMTNSDLSKLFENIGPLKRCGIHLTEHGQGNGTADVEFVFPEDANRAKEEYAGRPLGGRPIVINWSGNKSLGRRRLGQRRINLRRQANRPNGDSRYVKDIRRGTLVRRGVNLNRRFTRQ